jgi:hypothetical protein
VEAIAPGDEIAAQFPGLAVRCEANRGRRAIKPVHAHISGFKKYPAPGGKPRAHEIFDNLVLGVDRDRLAASEFVQVDAMAAPVEPQLNSVMDESFALQAIPDASFDQHIHRALLEHACADALFDIFPAAHFDND